MRLIAKEMGSSHEDGYLIRTRISQDLQAAMLGITRQTLNKEMAELKRSGVIKKLGSHYWVKD
ncbi:winged helix-turn-helix domain-containing protein [Ketobacter sp. MCCC 1A13808]|uniref:helix-turn-helix domain-containing protein n=1 Tax=Ketobacter sp. MCCC 1A13808 TaxID=2602738 RepID=UPI0012EBF0D2|nr:helix-turn-helix domain-containing protein [Ketobacter sp. MCCC 1A13808]MVF14371.1 winged helix-turn-helix domain-containing protein [Ketobacter sp. MCCC 1A13808]